MAFVSPLWAQIPELSPGELDSLGARIFQYECSGQFDCLTGWNEGEAFPSLGIGHFIWFQAGQQAPFSETFPTLLAYLEARGARLPDWLQDPRQRESPWQSRQQFFAEFDQPRSRELRQFLFDTRDLQAEFIVARMQESWQSILAQAPPAQRASLAARLRSVAGSQPPAGVFALIDYVHFKGTGLNPEERYQGQGWGLLQVLQQLPEQPDLVEFVASAREVLARRVANAPPERQEQRWLTGWRNRVDSYLPAPP